MCFVTVKTSPFLIILFVCFGFKFYFLLFFFVVGFVKGDLLEVNMPTPHELFQAFQVLNYRQRLVYSWFIKDIFQGI